MAVLNHWMLGYLAFVVVAQILSRPGRTWNYRFTALALVILFAVFIGWAGSVLG